MLTAARIFLPPNGQQASQPDQSTKGWMQVVYKGEVRWARPCYAMGHFTPPNDLWLRKYAEKFAVWVTTERTELHEEHEDHLVYLGFLPLEDVLPTDIQDAFPEKQLFFTSRWEVVSSEDPADPYIELRYTADPDEQDAPADPGATIFKLSQKPNSQSIELTQIVDGTPSGSKLTLQPNGSFSLTVKGGASYTLEQTKAETQLDGGMGFKVEGKDSNATLTLGTGTVHATIYEELLSFMGSLKTWLATHTHTAPSGPTSPPTQAATVPDLPAAAKASKLKIPS